MGNNVVQTQSQHSQATTSTITTFNSLDWKKFSIKHRQKFEKLLVVWKNNPEMITVINGNGVSFKEDFFVGGGCCGTEVYICLGLDGIERAIKRLPIRVCQKLLKNERDILSSPNAVESPRIVNYWFYDDTSNPDFGYLILNLYETNLEEHVREKSGTITESRAQEMIRQVLEGLKALHARMPRILHRDLKPTNILVDVNGDLVLSDFGIGRFFLEADPTTYYTSCTESGSMGWMAHECIDWVSLCSQSGISASEAKQLLKWKEKSDIQVAGMLAFFILTKGNHPFGAKIERLNNFYKNQQVGLKQLADPVVKDLLSQMLARDLHKRPYVEQALKHPYFLSAKEQMKLVQAVGNEPEIKKGSPCDVVNLLDNLSPPQPRSCLLPPDWKAVMDPDDLTALCMEGKPPSCLNGDCYTHCLRLIRNVFQHWYDKPRQTLKDMRQATCLEEYFLQLFPRLPFVLHQIVRASPDWKTRPVFEEFFPVVNRRTGSAQTCHDDNS